MAGNYSEVGVSGLQVWSGRIQEDFLRNLRWPDAFKIYNEMRLNSPTVGALLAGIELSIRGIDWTWTSEDETDPRIRILEDASEAMSHNMLDHISEALTFLPFGWSWFETVYQQVDSRVLWRKFAIRGQDTLHKWEFDDSGGIAAMIQRLGWGEEYELPIEKSILYRARSEKNNPEGRSILRTAYIPWYYAKHLMEIEAIGEERGLAGLPVIEPPFGANMKESDSSSDYAKAHSIVRNIRRDEQEGIVLPAPTGPEAHQRWKISLLSTGVNRTFGTDAIIKRYESRILMSALSQFMMLGMDKVGSLALSKDQTDFFIMSVNAIADIVGETLTKYAMPRLLALNGITDFDGVRLEHSPAGDMDMTALGEFLAKTTNMITWMPDDEVWLRDVVRLPEREVEEIEAEKEKRKAERQATMPAPGMPGVNPFQPRQDGMGAELFVSDRAPDDDQRRKNERAWERTIKKFFGDQRGRVERGARRIER